jgi:transcriptional regulator with XRE-family HTH domain
MGGQKGFAMTIKLTNDVMQWVDAQLARDPGLRERVEQRMAELRLEEELVALREARGLTQGQLARLLGISQPAVAKIEAGRQRNIGLRTLMNFITALGGELQVRVKAQPARVTGLRPASNIVYRSARTGAFVSKSARGETTVSRVRTNDRKHHASITVSRASGSQRAECEDVAMGKERETTLRGPDARTGQFINVKDARKRPNTTVVERVPLPGKGRKE